MKKKILSLAIALTVTVLMSVSAFADLTIKPVPDPWDDPSNQEADGASYYAHNEAVTLSFGKLPSAMSTANMCL